MSMNARALLGAPIHQTAACLHFIPDSDNIYVYPYMNIKTPADRMFKAFADETRLRILNLLARRRELCVCDIQKILEVSQPKVSRHLAYLRNAGLVLVRKEGLWKHYSLTRAESGFHRGLINCLRGCFSEVKALQKDLKALEKIQSRKSACS